MKQVERTRYRKDLHTRTGAPPIIREASKLDCVYQGSFAVHTLVSSTSTAAQDEGIISDARAESRTRARAT